MNFEISNRTLFWIRWEITVKDAAESHLFIGMSDIWISDSEMPTLADTLRAKLFTKEHHMFLLLRESRKSSRLGVRMKNRFQAELQTSFSHPIVTNDLLSLKKFELLDQ